jgi:hypothetical protein
MVLDHSLINKIESVLEFLFRRSYVELIKINEVYFLRDKGSSININFFVKNYTMIDLDKGVLSPLDTYELYNSLMKIVSLFRESLLDKGRSSELLIHPHKKGFKIYSFSSNLNRVEPITDVNFYNFKNILIIKYLEFMNKIVK